MKKVVPVKSRRKLDTNLNLSFSYPFNPPEEIEFPLQGADPTRKTGKAKQHVLIKGLKYS